MLTQGGPGSAVILAELALVNAADAALQKDGWRVRGKTGSHEARFDFPDLPEVFRQKRPLVDQVRSLRNEEAYGGSHPVSQSQAADMVVLADSAIAEVEGLLP